MQIYPYMKRHSNDRLFAGAYAADNLSNIPLKKATDENWTKRMRMTILERGRPNVKKWIHYILFHIIAAASNENHKRKEK